MNFPSISPNSRHYQPVVTLALHALDHLKRKTMVEEVEVVAVVVVEDAAEAVEEQKLNGG